MPECPYYNAPDQKIDIGRSQSIINLAPRRHAAFAMNHPGSSAAPGEEAHHE